MAVRPLILAVLFSTLLLVVYAQPAQYTIAGLFPITTFNFDTLETDPSSPEVLSQITAFQLAIEDINNDPTILGNTVLNYQIFDTQATTTGALAALVNAVEQNITLIVGPSTSDQSTISAVAGGVYDVFLLSPTASSTVLSDKTLYPYFARSVPPNTEQAEAMVDFILYYHQITGIAQWLNVSVICTADDYGVDGSKQFIALGEVSTPPIVTKSFQQFLVGATDVTIEVRELKDSGARVFIVFMAAEGYRTVLKEAKKKEIVGDYYVWICSDGCATDAIFEVPDGDQLTARSVKQLSRGLVGVSFSGGRGIRYDEYLDRWYELDPVQYPGAGQPPEVDSLLAYDSVYASAFTLQTLFDSLIYEPTGLDLFEAITFIEFIGITGDYNIDEVGDRDGDYTIENLWPDYTFYPIFYWNQSVGLVPIAETHWHDGTTEIPDLSVKEEFDYWSCHKKEQGTDPTGKTIRLEEPDGDDVNYIDADYECDQFIDCQNMSDESYQCGPSFVIAFIVVGIITGVVIGLILCIIVFILIFGWIVPRARIWLSGKTFLLVLAIAALVCCASTYAWYGKAHTVACNFQLWLFGLSASAIASAFFAKQIRFWREMEFPIQRVRKSKVFTVLKNWKEVEFIAWFCIAMIFPLFILILWTAMSTPVADIEDIDGDDHFICTSGGVGKPAGVVLFFILFGYLEFLLFVCLGFSFLLRHVPQPFMDKRLVSIAVFNLIFVSAVVVGIFFVLRWISPFAAWLIRTIAMLYCPMSSVLLLMVPKMVGIVIVDKFAQNLGRGRGAGPTKNNDQSVPLDPSMSSSNTQSMGL